MLWILQLSIWQPVVPWNTRLRRSWHQWPWQFFVFGVGHCQTLEDAPHQTEVNHVNTVTREQNLWKKNSLFRALRWQQYRQYRLNVNEKATHWRMQGLINWTWWRHQIETFSVLLALCEGNPPIPLTKASAVKFGVFFDLRLNKQLSKQSRRRWFETPLRSLWRHCNILILFFKYVVIMYRSYS